MKIPGRICLFLLIALFAAGASFGQTDPVQEDAVVEDTGQVETETNEPAEAPAETTSRSSGSQRFGVRAGYTSWDSINQLHVGAHYYVGEIWPNFEFTPNIEVGFGDSITIATLSADLAYNFTEFFAFPWSVYGGLSLSFNYVNPDWAGSDTDIGGSGLVGTTYTFANDHKGMAEIRFGLIDSPDFKLTFGYTLF
ncbi:MAG: hypothetical protein KAH56_08000 [Candidatus Krumholzibacteria bacterium]|nr:hypothetical protein [Candidatus Krumholzibacteria bacterium]